MTDALHLLSFNNGSYVLSFPKLCESRLFADCLLYISKIPRLSKDINWIMEQDVTCTEGLCSWMQMIHIIEVEYKTCPYCFKAVTLYSGDISIL